MASGPDKKNASASERSLFSQGVRDVNEANRIINEAQPSYLKRAKKDNTQKMKNRLNADTSQAAKSSATGNVIADLAVTRAANRGRSSGMEKARYSGKNEKNQNSLNAVRIGKGMNAVAQEGTSALAQISTQEAIMEMQREMQKEQDNINALTSLAIGGYDMYTRNSNNKKNKNTNLLSQYTQGAKDGFV